MFPVLGFQLFLLVSVLSKTLLSFVGSNLMAFSFLSARHNDIVLE